MEFALSAPPKGRGITLPRWGFLVLYGQPFTAASHIGAAGPDRGERRTGASAVGDSLVSEQGHITINHRQLKFAQVK